MESVLEEKELNGSLICGLPDDIALLCLAMVPRRYHGILRCVSRRWRTVVGSQEWHSCRRKNNLEESWIYVMCRDKLRGNRYYVLDPRRTEPCWKPLPSPPLQCLKNEGMSLEASGRKLYLMGGCSWQKDASDEVYCYDACTSKWEMGAPMPTSRCYFSSAALNEKLYVTGGLGTSSSILKSWDIYDIDSNTWSSQRDPTTQISDVFKFVPLDGKIYTIHKDWTDSCRAGVYDPSGGTWDPFEPDITRCCRGPAVDAGGTLFMLDETIGTRLMTWRKESNDWVALGRLSHHFTRPPCQIASIGRTVYLIGQGLSVMYVDVDRVAKLEGVLLSSSLVPKFNPDFSVVCCKTITI